MIMKNCLRKMLEITLISYSLSLRERVGERGHNTQVISFTFLSKVQEVSFAFSFFA